MAVIVPILSTFNAAGINAATGALGALGNSLKRIGAQAAVAAVGVKAMGAAVDFVSESVTSARDLQRNLFALNTVFGELSPKMVQFTKDAAGMGISQTDAARTATFLGSVLKQAGFGMGDVSTETMKLTGLAQDLATTYGYDVSEALTAMTALFRGEYDPIEKFGVALKQNEINTILAAKGMDKLTGQALLNAQQQVRLEQLYLRSADAQGAFAAQSGTLYGVQARLNAAFQNLQSSLGEGLLPVLARMGELLIPIVAESGPKIGEVFSGIGQVMTALMPLITPVLRILGDLLGVVGKLFQFISPLISLLSTGLAVVLDMIAEKMESVGRGLDQIFGFFSDIYQVTNSNFGSGFMDFLKSASAALGKIIPGLGLFNDFMNRFEAKSAEQNQARSMAADSARLTAQAQAYFKSKEPPTPDPEPGKIATDYVKEFYAALAQEDRKQRATLKLKSLGATQGLIENIIGSGEGWMKVYTSIIAGGKASVAQVQSLFSKTKAGIKEIADAAQAAAEVALEAAEKAKKLADEAAQKIAEENSRIAGIWDTYQAQLVENLKTYQNAIAEADSIYADSVTSATDKAKESMDEMRSSMQSTLESVIAFAKSEEDLGKWESQAVSAFNGVADALKAGLASGALLQDGYNQLSAYAQKESAILRSIGRQRDELAEKKSLVTTLMSDIRQAISGNVRLSSFLVSESQKITQTVTKMVGNVRVATTTTFDSIVTQNSIVSNFRKLVDGTKSFIANLKTLKALGLNQDLYQQILMQGAEAGGATAQALVDGGADTVSEVNNLFKEINDMGASLAEQTAQTMYGAGLDLTNGIIAGINAQDQLLAQAGTSLATIFAETFKLNLDSQLAIAFAKAVADAEEAARKIRDAAKAAALEAKIQADAIALDAAKAAAAWTEAGQAAENAAKRAAAAMAGISSTTAQDTSKGLTLSQFTAAQNEFMATQIAQGVTPDFSVAAGGSFGRNGYTTNSNTVNVTVNAGLGTDGAVLGGQIVNLIKKYEKTSGMAFA
jgi:hypothetical protein